VYAEMKENPRRRPLPETLKKKKKKEHL